MGLQSLRLTGLAALGGVAALQLPLVSHEQVALAGKPDPVSRPLIDTEALQDAIKAENLLSRAKELYEIAKLGEPEYNHPTRVIGSDGHLGTLSYIYSVLAQLGDYYTLSNQTFPAVSGNVFESRLVIGNDVLLEAYPMSLTPPTKNKQPVHGDLVLIDNEGCEESDFPAEVKDNIAFIIRGKCSFGAKSEQAGKAGAVAAIIFNNEDGDLGGTLGSPSPYHVATFGVSGKAAAPYVKKLEHGKHVDVIAYIDAEVATIMTNNIIAQTIEGDPDNCVMLGGHSDSVSEGPGINDDGSGSLTVLEVAVQLANFSVNNCVRFAWWAGEEEGLLGSDYYVSVLSPEENQKIRLFMDYDMLGSPNFAYQVYDARNDRNPVGSQELRDLYVDWYKDHDLNYTFIEFDGRSDYDGFIKHGIPGGGIATGAEVIKTKEEANMFGGDAGIPFDPCYHLLCDTVENVNMTAWEVNSKLVAHSVATFAKSFKGFPERTKADVKASSVYEQTVKYHGSKLYI